MARITVEDCLQKIGNENRFALIHLAVKRVKQHRRGVPFIVPCRNKEIVATLREIASGSVSFTNISELEEISRNPEAMVRPAADNEAEGVVEAAEEKVEQQPKKDEEE